MFLKKIKIDQSDFIYDKMKIPTNGLKYLI